MGGGYKVVEGNRQYLESLGELDCVNFYIDIHAGNFELFDYSRLHDLISIEVSKYFKKIAISYNDIGPLERGGGGGLSFKEVFDFLLETWNIIEFSISVFTLAKLAYLNWLENFQIKPIVKLYFYIETKGAVDYLDKGELTLYLSRKLQNLHLVCNSIAKHLSEEFEPVQFDLNFGANIKQINYEVRFDIAHNFRNAFNLGRILRLIHYLKVRGEVTQFYQPNRLGIINYSRMEYLKREEGLVLKSSELFYLLLSAGDLKDFFQTKY